MTPEGWSRAEILLATLREPPRVGSLRESILQRFVLLKANIEHARLTVLVQAAIDPKGAGDSYAQYVKTAFPWEETETKRSEQDLLKFLSREVANGPMAITPVGATSIKSRLAAKSGDNVRSGRILSKIGRTLPRN